MISKPDPILALVAQMERARKSGLTDGEQRLKDRSFELLKELHDLCDATHAMTTEEVARGEKLRTQDILWAIAALTAFYIDEFGEDALAKLIALGRHNQMILSIIAETGANQ